ncbi:MULTISPECIES: DNA cytosine methyltransferase [unclassified Flavobacterium]|uniref:DNA cytosine methyltransferase n=1 Tax=unclassified Flavobacterium TaxID=196869 RepID=UPI001F13F2A5|nr:MULTISPECIES: DNA cytosine methyltransferase [unclassified Flavobacterium]UMY66452.1 DNA cytosine methyltransferase [Flavobacterium sp. HJ-32-4]
MLRTDYLPIPTLESILLEDEFLYYSRKSKDADDRKEYKLIDLFCGAGGMTLGFTRAFGHNFKPIWANDYNKESVETYNKNFGNHCIEGDIVEILSDPNTKIPKADIVIGGPPCQGFSLLNRNRQGDPRRELWRPFLEVVRRSEAKLFIIENVPQLLGSQEHADIIETAEAMGFRLASGKLMAADYGVPQKRTRAFIIGVQNIDPTMAFPPRKTHYNPDGPKGQAPDLFMPQMERWQTVRDAIYDLAPPDGTNVSEVRPPMNLHFGRTPTPLSIRRYHAIPLEGMNRFDLQKNAPDITPDCWIRKTTGGTDLFGRLWWDRPAVTIRTEFFKPEKGRYLHPEQHRPITHREAARLQSFPDSFVFAGSKIEIAKQIGNAVPPVLAARIADVAYVLLKHFHEENQQ